MGVWCQDQPFVKENTLLFEDPNDGERILHEETSKSSTKVTLPKYKGEKQIIK